MGNLYEVCLVYRVSFVMGIMSLVSIAVVELTRWCASPDHVWLGSVLRRPGPVLVWHVGVMEEQHVWGDSLHQLRVLLDELGHLQHPRIGAVPSCLHISSSCTLWKLKDYVVRILGLCQVLNLLQMSKGLGSGL